jgi:hypothetical protein
VPTEMDGVPGRVSVFNQLPSRKKEYGSGCIKSESKDFSTSDGASPGA